MRLKLIIVAIMAVIGAGIAGCQQKEQEKPQSFYSMRVVDSVFRSNQTMAYLSDTIVKNHQSLVIEGVTNNFKTHMQLIVTFPNGAKPGTYTEGVEISLMDILQQKEGFIGKTITVHITSINSAYAEGSFSGTLISGEIEKPLTDGTFKVNLY